MNWDEELLGRCALQKPLETHERSRVDEALVVDQGPNLEEEALEDQQEPVQNQSFAVSDGVGHLRC